MKKLLAHEMSKENESGRRPPSVIARLMGFDGLPPQQPGHKQLKGIETSHDKDRKGGSAFSSRKSSRKSSKDEQEFKDVFEVIDALNMEGAGYFSPGTANSKLSDVEVAFIRQKFMEAKRLSTDEKLQDSEEFNDALEILESNTDLRLKFFQQPDSLFTKHLHDLQGMPDKSHCGRVSALKSRSTLDSENGRLAQRTGRETRMKHHSKSPQGYQENNLSHSYGRYDSHSPCKSTSTLGDENGHLSQRTGRETRTKHHSKSPQGYQENNLSHSYRRYDSHSPCKSTSTLDDENGCLSQRTGRETRTKHHSKSPQSYQENNLSHSYRRYDSHSPCKSTSTLDDENGRLSQRTGRETRTKHHSKSPQGYQENNLSHSYGRYASHSPCKSPMVQLGEINGPAIVPTKIVVLKPNCVKSENSSRTALSPGSSHNYSSKSTRHSEILDVQNKEVEMGRNKVLQDAGFSRHNSRDSREMAKEITLQMKNSFNDKSMTISTSRFRGYAGDESSCDVSGYESTNDLDVTTVSYRDNIGWNKHHRRSSSRSSESSVSREAKKRLSARWKATHKSQEVRMVSRGSTLGEMLATSDREVIPGNSSGLVGVEGCNQIGNRGGPAVSNEPLCISSRDGWKDGCLGNLSRSRSVSASSTDLSTDFGSPRVSARPESHRRDKYVIPKEGFKRERNKTVKGNFNQKEAQLPSNQRSCVKKSQLLGSSCSSSKEYCDTSRDSDVTPYQVKRNIEGDKQSEHKLMVSGFSSTAMDSSSVLENAADVKEHIKTLLSEPSPMELSAPVALNAAVVSTGDVDNLHSQGPSEQTTSHCPVSELESRANCKEAEQPSPVSVIEAPFTDDISSGSECFESISADLHELRMQLRQLKLESEAYEEGTMLLSSDDDSNEVSVGSAEDNGRPKTEEDWESVYIADVLVHSGVGGTEVDICLAAWQSAECPVNLLVFEQLENKYCTLNSWSRAERRLMFDRINSKLLEIYQHYIDHMISARKTIPKWKVRELEDSLRKSLVNENKKQHMDEGEMALAGQCQWLYLRSDIETINRGIERMLVDELVAEVVAG